MFTKANSRRIFRRTLLVCASVTVIIGLVEIAYAANCATSLTSEWKGTLINNISQGDNTWASVREGQSQTFGFAIKNNGSWAWSDSTDPIRLVYTQKTRGTTSSKTSVLSTTTAPGVFGGNDLFGGGGGTTSCMGTATNFPSGTPGYIGPGSIWVTPTFTWTPSNIHLGLHQQLYAIRYKQASQGVATEFSCPSNAELCNISNSSYNGNYLLSTVVVPYNGLAVGNSIFYYGYGSVSGHTAPRVEVTYKNASNVNTTVSTDSGSSFVDLPISATNKNLTIKVTDVSGSGDPTMRYYLDWAVNGSRTYNSDNSQQSSTGATLSWNYNSVSVGTDYTFYGQIKDESGDISPWKPITVRFVNGSTAAPACALSASPSTISSGGSSTLTWTTSGSPTSASINQGIGSVSTSGGSRTVNPSSTTTYILTVSNSGGSNTCSATVNVGSGSTSTASTVSTTTTTSAGEFYSLAIKKVTNELSGENKTYSFTVEKCLDGEACNSSQFIRSSSNPINVRVGTARYCLNNLPCFEAGADTLSNPLHLDSWGAGYYRVKELPSGFSVRYPYNGADLSNGLIREFSSANTNNTYIFENYGAPYKITVNKSVSGGSPGSNWKFELYKCTTSQCAAFTTATALLSTTINAGGGSAQFDVNSFGAGTYEVREIDIPSGWQVNQAIQRVTLTDGTRVGTLNYSNALGSYQLSVQSKLTSGSSISAPIDVSGVGTGNTTFVYPGTPQSSPELAQGTFEAPLYLTKNANGTYRKYVSGDTGDFLIFERWECTGTTSASCPGTSTQRQITAKPATSTNGSHGTITAVYTNEEKMQVTLTKKAVTAVPSGSGTWTEGSKSYEFNTTGSTAKFAFNATVVYSLLPGTIIQQIKWNNGSGSEQLDNTRMPSPLLLDTDTAGFGDFFSYVDPEQVISRTVQVQVLTNKGIFSAPVANNTGSYQFTLIPSPKVTCDLTVNPTSAYEGSQVSLTGEVNYSRGTISKAYINWGDATDEINGSGTSLLAISKDHIYNVTGTKKIIVTTTPDVGAAKYFNCSVDLEVKPESDDDGDEVAP